MEGYEVKVQAPAQPPVLPLPKWLQKALSKDSAVCRKAAAAPWSAQVPEQGSGPDRPISLDPNKDHYTLRWIMRQLLRCLLRKNAEGKGEWWRDAAKVGAWDWQPVPGGPISPLQSFSSGVPKGHEPAGRPPGGQVWHRPPLLCLQQWVALGWCQRWPQVNSVQFAPVWSVLLALPNPSLHSRSPVHLRSAGA